MLRRTSDSHCAGWLNTVHYLSHKHVSIRISLAGATRVGFGYGMLQPGRTRRARKPRAVRARSPSQRLNLWLIKESNPPIPRLWSSRERADRTGKTKWTRKEIFAIDFELQAISKISLPRFDLSSSKRERVGSFPRPYADPIPEARHPRALQRERLIKDKRGGSHRV